MVEKRDPATPTGAADAPAMPREVAAAELRVPEGFAGFDARQLGWATGGSAFWEDYAPGERIDHVDGMTIDETDHTTATRLYQNTARVHFDAHQMASSRFGRRLMYGGHVISVAWALAYNGLENALGILAWNGGSHAAPTFAGDTLYAFSEVVDKQPLAGRGDVGALRIKLGAAKNLDAARQPLDPKDERRVLELDLWLLVGRRG
jgi:2-methylfumaryl-CoA hydratase